MRHNPLNLVVLCMLWAMGASAFADTPSIATVFILFAYLTLLVAFLTTNQRWRDWINPLAVVLMLGFLRFGIPGLLLALGAEPQVDVFRAMRLTGTDWLFGHMLALLGLLGVVLGWWMPSKWLGSVLRRTVSRVNVRLTRGVRYTAAAAMLIGVIALLAFVATNASLGDVIRTGDFRRTEIQEGTGPYFWLSLFLIAGSVAFSTSLLTRGAAWWVTLLPASIAMLLFWPLGGRVRALTPVAALLLLLWYRKGRSGFPIKGLVVLMIGLLPAVLLAGQLYRGGLGIEGIAQAFSIEAVSGYINGAIWVDWGQLHALAGAAKIGPGRLGGQTFVNLLWPVSAYVFNQGGRSAGVFITETLVGFGRGKKWGFHSSLIGDAYLNYGLAGVLVATVTFGILLRRLYLGWRAGWIDGPFYALAFLYGTRMFFESVEKFSEGWIVLLFMFLVIRAGQVSLKASARTAPGRLAAAPETPLAT